MDTSAHRADRRIPPSEAAVDAAPVGHPQRQNHEFSVFDRVNDPIIADTNAPQIWIPDERASTVRARSETQSVDGLDDTASHGPIELG